MLFVLHFFVFVYSPGSVIVSFVVYFTRPVTTDEGLAELRGAVNNGSIGPFEVSDLTVVGPQPTTTPEEKTTQKPTSTCFLKFATLVARNCQMLL